MIALAVLVGVLAVLIGGTLGYLNSGAGEARIRGMIVSAAQDALQGPVDVGGFELNGRTVVLHDVTLKTPEGEPVASVAEARAHILLAPLLHHTVHLDSVEITRPVLTLVKDVRGLNLSRAIALKHPKPPQPSQPSAWTIDIEKVALTDGAVSFEQSQGQPQKIALTQLAGDGSAFIGGGENGELRAKVKLGGAMTEPVQGPVSVTARVHGRGDAKQFEVVLDAPGFGLTANARMKGTEQLNVDLKRVELAPATAQAFVPSYPLEVPLTAHGSLVRNGNWDTLKLQAQAGSATLDVNGTLDLAQFEARSLEVHARGLDLRQLTGQGEPTNLALDLSGHAKGTSLENLSGAVTLNVPASRVAGQPVGPIALQAHAQNGQITIDRLRGQLPGVSLQAGGTLNSKTLDLSANVNATDLNALNRTFSGLTGKVLPKLSGSGQLTLHLRGPTRHPSLQAQGTVKSLQAGANGVTALNLSANVPDVRKPLEANASVSAAEVSIGGKRLKNLATDVRTKGRHLVADFRTQGLAEVVLHVEGLLDESGEGARVEVLTLSWPEETWKLEQATHVTFAGARLDVSPLTLRSGDQSIALEGHKLGSRLRAHVQIAQLALDQLPDFLTEQYQLDGTINADLSASGRLPRPDVVAKVTVENGAAFGYSGLGLDLDGRYVRDRAVGQLKASGAGVGIQGQFDLPVQGLIKRRREPVKVDLTVAKLSVGDTLCQLAKVSAKQARLCPGGKPIATGHASAEVHLSGDADVPKVSLVFMGDQLQQGNLPATDIKLAVFSEAGDTLGAQLAIGALGGYGAISVHTPLMLATLLDHPPTAAQLLAVPVDVDLKGGGFQLTPLYRSGLVTRWMKGTASFEGHLQGPLRAPLGDVTATVAGGKIAGSPVVDLSMKAHAGEKEVTAELTAMQASKALAELHASVAQSLEALRDPKHLGDAPFKVEATVGPIALEDYALYTQGEVRPDQQLHGMINAAFGASGTLNAPQATGHLTVQRLGVGPDALGRAETTLTYANGKAALKAALTTIAGGVLQLDGESTLNLSYPALRKGLAVGKAPVSATLRAKDFDLSFLSGMTPTVRKISGPLQADATVTGTLGDPTWRGKVEWTHGAVSLTGFGEYHDIHLALNATNQRIDLSDVTVKSGGGTLNLSAAANRAGERWVLNGQGKADTFPIVSDDQLLATASLRTTFNGEITEKLVNIRNLSIPEAHFELPQVARKDLQALQRPEDVVLMRNGRPVDRDQRRDPTIRADLRKVTQQTGPVAPLPPEPEPARQFWVTVNAPRNIWIRGEDVNAEIGLSQGFHVEISNKTALFGEVKVMRARLDVIGRRFDVRNDSSVRFAGAALMPFVNVTAVYKSESEQVTVYLTIRGQGKDITLKVSSDPPLSESEIYTLLATGRLTLKRGSGATMSSGQAASIVGSLAASQLKKSLASKLPLDVLSIEAGSQGIQGSKLEAGTYVTDKVYVGYTGQLGADPSKGENSNAVKLEYQISPHWSFEMEYGDARAGGADLIWTKDY